MDPVLAKQPKHKASIPDSDSVVLPTVKRSSSKPKHSNPERIYSSRGQPKKKGLEDSKKKHPQQFTIREMVLETQLQADRKMRRALMPYLSSLPANTPTVAGSPPTSPLLLRLKEVSLPRSKKNLLNSMEDLAVDTSDTRLNSGKKYLQGKQFTSKSQQDMMMLQNEYEKSLPFTEDDDKYEVVFLNKSSVNDQPTTDKEDREEHQRERHQSKQSSWRGLADYSGHELVYGTRERSESKPKQPTVLDSINSESRSAKVLKIIAKRVESQGKEPSKKAVELPKIVPKAINFHMRRGGNPAPDSPLVLPTVKSPRMPKNTRLLRARSINESIGAEVYRAWDDTSPEHSKKSIHRTLPQSKSPQQNKQRKKKPADRLKKIDVGPVVDRKVQVPTRKASADTPLADVHKNAPSIISTNKRAVDYSKKHMDRVVTAKNNGSQDIQNLDTSINSVSQGRTPAAEPQQKSWIESSPGAATKVSARYPYRQRVSIRSNDRGQKDSESQSTNLLTSKPTKELNSDMNIVGQKKPTNGSNINIGNPIQITELQTNPSSSPATGRSLQVRGAEDTDESANQIGPLLLSLGAHLQTIKDNTQQRPLGAGKRSMLVSNSSLIKKDHIQEEPGLPTVPFTTREDRKSSTSIRSELESGSQVRAIATNLVASLPKPEVEFPDLLSEIANEFVEDIFDMANVADEFTENLFDDMIEEFDQFESKQKAIQPSMSISSRPTVAVPVKTKASEPQIQPKQNAAPVYPRPKPEPPAKAPIESQVTPQPSPTDASKQTPALKVQSQAAAPKPALPISTPQQPEQTATLPSRSSRNQADRFRQQQPQEEPTVVGPQGPAEPKQTATAPTASLTPQPSQRTQPQRTPVLRGVRLLAQPPLQTANDKPQQTGANHGTSDKLLEGIDAECADLFVRDIGLWCAAEESVQDEDFELVDAECAHGFVQEIHLRCATENAQSQNTVDLNLAGPAEIKKSVTQSLQTASIAPRHQAALVKPTQEPITLIQPVADVELLEDVDEFITAIDDWASTQLAIRDTLAEARGLGSILLGANKSVLAQKTASVQYPIKVSVPPCRMLIEYQWKLLKSKSKSVESQSESDLKLNPLRKQSIKSRTELLKEGNYSIRLKISPSEAQRHQQKPLKIPETNFRCPKVPKSTTCGMGEYYAGTGLSFFTSYISRSKKSTIYSARSGRRALVVQASVEDTPSPHDVHPLVQKTKLELDHVPRLSLAARQVAALGTTSAGIYLAAPDDGGSRSSFAKNPRSLLRGKNLMNSGSRLGSFSSSNMNVSPADIKSHTRGLAAESATISDKSYAQAYEKEILFLKQQGDRRAEELYRERNNLYKSQMNSMASSKVEECFRQTPRSSYEKSEFEMDFKPPRKIKGFDPSKHEYSNDDNGDGKGENNMRRKAANVGMSAIANLKGFEGAKNKFENANDPFSQFKMIRLGNGPYDFLIQDFEVEDDFQHLVMGDEKSVKVWSEDTIKVMRKQAKGTVEKATERSKKIDQLQASKKSNLDISVKNKLRKASSAALSQEEEEDSDSDGSGDTGGNKQKEKPPKRSMTKMEDASDESEAESGSKSSTSQNNKKSRLIINSKLKKSTKKAKKSDESEDGSGSDSGSSSSNSDKASESEDSEPEDDDSESSEEEEEGDAEAERSQSGYKNTSKATEKEKALFVLNRIHMHWDSLGIRGLQASYRHQDNMVEGKIHGGTSEETGGLDIAPGDRCYEVWTEIGDNLLKCLKFVLGRGDTVRLGPDDYDSRTRVYNYSIKRRKLSRIHAGFNSDGYLVCLAFKLVKSRL